METIVSSLEAIQGRKCHYGQPRRVRARRGACRSAGEPSGARARAGACRYSAPAIQHDLKCRIFPCTRRRDFAAAILQPPASQRRRWTRAPTWQPHFAPRASCPAGARGPCQTQFWWPIVRSTRLVLLDLVARVKCTAARTDLYSCTGTVLF